jgi:hypothetical protein
MGDSMRNDSVYAGERQMESFSENGSSGQRRKFMLKSTRRAPINLQRKAAGSFAAENNAVCLVASATKQPGKTIFMTISGTSAATSSNFTGASSSSASGATTLDKLQKDLQDLQKSLRDENTSKTDDAKTKAEKIKELNEEIQSTEQQIQMEQTKEAQKAQKKQGADKTANGAAKTGGSQVGVQAKRTQLLDVTA